MKNKKALLISSILLTSVLSMAGCSLKNPATTSAYPKQEKLLNVNVPEFSEEYYCGVDYIGDNYSGWKPKTKIVVCTNKDVLIYMSTKIDKDRHYSDVDVIDKVTLSDEQYTNIVNAVDRERLYKMDLNDDLGVCDGSTDYIYLYGENNEVVKEAGGYGGHDSFPDSYWDMYNAVLDNLPEEVDEIIERQDYWLEMISRDYYFEENGLEDHLKRVSSGHYGDVISFSKIENEYTDLIDYHRNKISMVLDLDNDGLNEAIVCETNRTLEDYTDDYSDSDVSYEIVKMYFIGEDKSVNVIDLFDGRYIYNDQFIVTKDGVSYVTMNGKGGDYGFDLRGEVLTVENDQYKFLVGDESYEGQFYFTSDDEMEFVQIVGNGWVSIDEGESLKYCYFEVENPYSYEYTLEDGELIGVPAMELSLEEVEAIGKLEIGYPSNDKNILAVQYIYRENGELDINYAVQKVGEIHFKCDKYFLEDGKWEYDSTNAGFIRINPNEENSWEFLTSDKIMTYVDGQMTFDLNNSDITRYDITAIIPEEWVNDKLRTIFFTRDVEINYVRWVDDEHTCLQLLIDYIDSNIPEDHYLAHKEDVFIFKEDIEILRVEYSYTDAEGTDRMVFANPSFEAYFEDINFDGVDDLIIPRGTNGNSGMEMYSAYVLNGNEYVFFPEFENMYSYTVDKANKTITCEKSSGDSRDIKYTSTYKYEDGKYVLIEENEE